MGLTSSSIGYLAISVINAGFSLMMIPIMTRLLGPEDYGFITLFFAYYASIGALTSISALTAYARSYYSIAEDRPVYLSTCLFLVAVTSLLFALMSLSCVGDLINELIGLSALWQFMACILVVLDEFFAAKLLVNRMQNKILSFGIFDISRNVARLIFILLFTAYFKLGAAGAIYGVIINTFIFSIISIIALFRSKDLVFKIKVQKINEILSFGIPLTPHAMGGAISSGVDKFLIAALLSNYELGLYAVGFSIGSIVKILEGSINTAFQPWLFKKLLDPNFGSKDIARIAFFITSTLLAFSIIILLLVHISLELFIGQKFQSAIDYIPWICGAYTVNGCYSVYNQVLIHKAKSIAISSITLFSILIGVVFSLILIKFHGAVGAAEAFFLTLLLRSVLTFLYSNKIMSLNF